MSLNKVFLIGRLTRDPELRYTSTMVPVTNFTLAVDRPFVNQKGERETDFIRIVAWRRLAEVCSEYLQKGLLACVYGRLQVRSYEDKTGNVRFISEVVANEVEFLEYPEKNDDFDFMDVPF